MVRKSDLIELLSLPKADRYIENACLYRNDKILYGILCGYWIEKSVN